jgi:hypothetical protein
LVDVDRPLDAFWAQMGVPAAHLSDEELQSFAAGSLLPIEKDRVLLHLSYCPACAGQAHELKAWAAAPRGVRWSYVAIAATLLVGVLVPATVWHWRPDRLNPESSLAGLDALAPADQAAVHAALDAGVAPLPEFMADITSDREALMGPPRTKGAFDLVAPVGTGTLSDRPRFEWQALQGASGYVVTVFDARSNVLARSPVVSESMWIPADPLPRDRTFVWQVTASRGQDEITVPAAPAAPARFHIVDARSAEVLQRLDAQHPQAHLLLGILYTLAGIRDAATRHLEQVTATDAHADVARRSLEKLRALAGPAQGR